MNNSITASADSLMNVLVLCTQNIMTQAELYHLISAGHPELCKWETFIQIQFIFVLIKKKTLKKPVSQTLEVFWRKEVTVPGGEQCQIMTWKNLCLLISEASSSPAPSLIAGFFCSSWNSESNGRESIQQHTSSTVHSGLSVSPEKIMKKAAHGEFTSIWQEANLLNEGHGLRREEARVACVIVDDAVKHLFFIITGERRLKKNTRHTILFLLCT